MRAITVAFIVAVAIPAVVGQTDTERFEAVRNMLERREYAEALHTLSSIEASDGERFRANNLDYLAARLHLVSGNSGRAATYFHQVNSRESILLGYAAWHLAEIARESGNPVAERILLLELLTNRPTSLLADAARQRLAQSYFESDDFNAAIASIDSMIGETPARPRDLELLHARALLFSGNKTAARDKFQLIAGSSPNPSQPDDLALEAVRALDLIDIGNERLGKEVAKLSDEDHFKRADVYHFNRNFADARHHLTAIVNDHPTSGLAPEAMYQIGRGYSQASDFTEAVKWYERLAEQYPDHSINKDALLQLAAAYARIGKHREAVTRYERYISAYPDGPQVDRAYLNIIDVLRDAGEDSEAVSRADRTAEVFRGKAGEAQAIFAKARIRLARANWENALSDLERLLELGDLGGTRIPGGTTRTEVTFLKGYSLEQLRRYAETVDTYLSIPDGRGEYYGWRATERLRALSEVPEARASIETRKASLLNERGSPDYRRRMLQQLVRIESDERLRAEFLNELRRLYADLPGYAVPRLPHKISVGRKLNDRPPKQTNRMIAVELVFLGLYDEAAPEFESVVRGLSTEEKTLSPEDEFAVVFLQLKGDRADRPATFAESFGNLPDDFQVELVPLELAAMLYPTPYLEALLQNAPPRNVDARFLLSLMRQESLFRPNARSAAAARGLMQFIPDTSNKIAREFGRERFDQNELYAPSTAILFGSQYVGNLFKLFPNQPEAVAASYNAGEDNMKRWYSRARSDDPGRYVPEIVYAQSKDYVWRVMTNYRMYQILYDERLISR